MIFWFFFFFFFFFFKQKTAYEITRRDWSSDVCSSDLLTPLALVTLGVVAPPDVLAPWGGLLPLALGVLYLASGWPLKAVHMAVMGFVLLALAISGQWDGATVAAGWAVLAAAASASGRWGRCPG